MFWYFLFWEMGLIRAVTLNQMILKKNFKTENAKKSSVFSSSGDLPYRLNRLLLVLVTGQIHSLTVYQPGFAAKNNSLFLLFPFLSRIISTPLSPYCDVCVKMVHFFILLIFQYLALSSMLCSSGCSYLSLFSPCHH